MGYTKQGYIKDALNCLRKMQLIMLPNTISFNHLILIPKEDIFYGFFILQKINLDLVLKKSQSEWLLMKCLNTLLLLKIH